MRRHSRTPPKYPATAGAVLWHYRRRIGGFVALALMSVLAAREPARTPTVGPTALAPSAVGDGARMSIYRSDVPAWGLGDEPFPDVQKRSPCTPDLEITWKGRCWMPHRARSPPCDAPGRLWAYEKLCLIPVSTDPRAFPNSLTPNVIEH